MKPPFPTLDPAPRAFYPPEAEPVLDEKTGKVIEPDPRTAVERTRQPTEDSEPQVLLDDALRAEAIAAGLVPAASRTDVQMAVEQTRRRPTRAQVQRLRLTQAALSLRAEGFSVPEIAEHLQVAPSTVTGWFSIHRRDVAVMDIDRMLEEIAVPLATENLVHGLIAGDKAYTLEVLKGRGRLKRPKEGDDERPRELPVLRVVVSAGGQVNMLVTGQTLDQMAHGGRVVGTAAEPKTIATEISEGEVVGVSSGVKE